MFYRDHEDTKERHTAGKELENIAKLAAAVVKRFMKSKRFLGMGVKY